MLRKARIDGQRGEEVAAKSTSGVRIWFCWHPAIPSTAHSVNKTHLTLTSRNKHEAKRQRTSQSSSSEGPEEAGNESEQDSPQKPATNGAKKIRGAAARNHAAKEAREKEQERERQEAVTRRKGRSDKRVLEGMLQRTNLSCSGTAPRALITVANGGIQESSLPEEPLKQTTPLARSRDRAESPPQTTPIPTKLERKKKAPPARKSRIGRNQYTRDRDPLANGNTHSSPLRAGSRDVQDEGSVNGNILNGSSESVNGSVTGGNNGSAKTKKNGTGNSAASAQHVKTNMNEMKRRVAAVLDFISRTQLEMAGSNENGSTPSSTTPAPTAATTSSSTAALVKGVEVGLAAAAAKQTGQNGRMMGDSPMNAGVVGGEDTPFENLSSLEMMDVLTRKLVKWQQEYGKAGDK